jgi:hypothetical protein
VRPLRPIALVAILPAWLGGAATAHGWTNRHSLLPIFDARTAELARRGAMARLRTTECQRVLTDFKDPGGRVLAENLARFALPADEYLATVVFLDGTGARPCEEGAQLFTQRAAGRLFVCKGFLRKVWARRAEAEVYLIHEMLHTLGLGENPPTSLEITAQVARRCAP